jgi:hypothetical protein
LDDHLVGEQGLAAPVLGLENSQGLAGVAQVADLA